MEPIKINRNKIVKQLFLKEDNGIVNLNEGSASLKLRINDNEEKEFDNDDNKIVLENLRKLSTNNIIKKQKRSLYDNAVLPSNLKLENNDYVYHINNVVINEPIENKQTYETINLCIYSIQENEHLNPTLIYLLNKNNNNNYLYFPNFDYRNFNNENLKDLIDENLNKMVGGFPKNPSYVGYLELGTSIYVFYELDFEYETVQLAYKNSWWWGTIYEIVNINKILNFEISREVYSIFYKNPLLISLFDKNENRLKTNNIAYFGNYYKYILFCIELGIPINLRDASYGPTYDFTSYLNAGNSAIWNTDKSKHSRGAIIRLEFSAQYIKYSLLNKQKLNNKYFEYDTFYVPASYDENQYRKIKFILRDNRAVRHLSYHFVDTNQINETTKYFNIKKYNIE